MKDTAHHLKYIQKKVQQSVRKESSQRYKNTLINGVAVLGKQESPPKS